MVFVKPGHWSSLWVEGEADQADYRGLLTAELTPEPDVPESLAAWGREIAELSATGLRTWGEASFLDPLFDVLDRGESPGTRLVKEIGDNPLPSNVLGQIDW